MAVVGTLTADQLVVVESVQSRTMSWPHQITQQDCFSSLYCLGAEGSPKSTQIFTLSVVKAYNC